MLSWIINVFKRNNKLEINNISLIDLDEMKQHFSRPNNYGFVENNKIFENIKLNIDPEKSNIFILDDIPEIVNILSKELYKSLKKFDKHNNFNIITMDSTQVGFDMIAILSNHDIVVDCLITDIIFGGTEKINGSNITVDGIDILILTKGKFSHLKFLIFTGNILSEYNIKNYDFALKFERFFKDNILKYTIIKDVAINFTNDNMCVFDDFVKTL